ncbi:peptidase S8 [Streptomyces sp. AJS327]|uniref:S8 family peptidase n=1 Tax=Streptomyces sp. AJS327 TaxID=2545265 RepID=UPI0015DEFA49|nr:S8 family serine peptidase [Streptomyces sp. AJS327]MBA0050502.1 peptidase S8 [Streptomyces sp. AJS327]
MPLGLALTASLGLAGAAVATAQDSPSAPKAADTFSYVVNTETDSDTVKRVEKEIASADGSVVETYDQIGVIVAHSANPDFGKTLRAVDGVDSAGATRTAPLTPAASTDIGKPEYVKAPKASAAANAKAKGEEPLESLQWDKRAIKADKASEISGGSGKVTVGVIDTGVDDTHPDLKANFASKQSANCVGGKADTSKGAWRPYTAEDYHGTHVAGIVAAPRNGVGVAGTAPGVKVSSIKVSEPDTSLFFAEAVVCAMVFAAENDVDITNNSYYVDPWLYACRDDADQKALVDSVSRAMTYARDKGTAHITSAGNDNQDLAAEEITDESSPNDSEPVTRTVDTENCVDMPTQLDGVTSVSATGPEKNLKSFYSNHGLGEIDVAGPGGDTRYQTPDAPAKNGGVLSTMPDGDYAYLQGTSMAGPNVAGVAALLKSQNPKATPQDINWMLKAQSKSVACPTDYDPDGEGTYAAECTGTDRDNSFYGHGIVDALKAVSK